MRKLVLLFSLIISGLVLSAQNSKVQSALNYIKPQYNQLDKAKEAIDLAVKHPKTEGVAKTWRVCGEVYLAIAQSQDEKFKGLKEGALETSLEAYKKAMELDVKGAETNAIKLKLLTLGSLFVNQGIEGFNTKEYGKAFASFQNSLAVDALVDPTKVDTAIVYNTGVAADLNKDYDNALKYYQKTIEFGYEGAKPYGFMAAIYKNNGDTVTYIETLKKGMEMHPSDNGGLVLELVNYYLTAEKTNEALLYIDKAIEKDNSNYSLYFAKGTLYDKLKDEPNAIASYEKSVELKPDYFDGYYNLGVIFFNRGAEKIKAANDIPANKPKEYDAAVKDALVALEASLPYLEKAHSIDPNEKSTVMTLKEIYFKLRNEKPEYMEKYTEMNEKAKAM